MLYFNDAQKIDIYPFNYNRQQSSQSACSCQ